jgi:hypothetical protein
MRKGYEGAYLWHMKLVDVSAIVWKGEADASRQWAMTPSVPYISASRKLRGGISAALNTINTANTTTPVPPPSLTPAVPLLLNKPTPLHYLHI